MNTIYLEANQVPAYLRGGYNGKQFRAHVVEEVTIPNYAGLWDGGSRDTYYAMDFDTGRKLPLSDNFSAPWDKSRKDQIVTLRPGFMVVMHSIFCGKDTGLTFYVHPENARKLLPAPVGEMSDHEKIVLNATRSYKSSYNGQDRYQMARNDFSYSRIHAGESFPSREQWDAAKQSLINKGLLDKRGAITVAGRNVAK